MNKTVREIARELGTNKNVVYRIIVKHNIEPVPNDNPKEPKRYSDESIESIKEKYSSLLNWRGETKTETAPVSSDESDTILSLKNQIERYEKEIDRLNETIRQKDEQISRVTDTLTETIKAKHLETIRYQEIIAREQSTRLMLAAQTTKFNLFKPSTWKRVKTETPDLEPLTPTDSDANFS